MGDNERLLNDDIQDIKEIQASYQQIIGLAVGMVIFILLIIGGVLFAWCCFLKKRKQLNRSDQGQASYIGYNTSTIAKGLQQIKSGDISMLGNAYDNEGLEDSSFSSKDEPPPKAKVTFEDEIQKKNTTPVTIQEALVKKSEISPTKSFLQELSLEVSDGNTKDTPKSLEKSQQEKAPKLSGENSQNTSGGNAPSHSKNAAKAQDESIVEDVGPLMNAIISEMNVNLEESLLSGKSQDSSIRVINYLSSVVQEDTKKDEEKDLNKDETESIDTTIEKKSVNSSRDESDEIMEHFDKLQQEDEIKEEHNVSNLFDEALKFNNISKEDGCQAPDISENEFEFDEEQAEDLIMDNENRIGALRQDSMANMLQWDSTYEDIKTQDCNLRLVKTPVIERTTRSFLAADRKSLLSEDQDALLHANSSTPRLIGGTKGIMTPLRKFRAKCDYTPVYDQRTLDPAAAQSPASRQDVIEHNLPSTPLTNPQLLFVNKSDESGNEIPGQEDASEDGGNASESSHVASHSEEFAKKTSDSRLVLSPLEDETNSIFQDSTLSQNNRSASVNNSSLQWDNSVDLLNEHSEHLTNSEDDVLEILKKSGIAEFLLQNDFANSDTDNLEILKNSENIFPDDSADLSDSEVTSKNSEGPAAIFQNGDSVRKEDFSALDPSLAEFADNLSSELSHHSSGGTNTILNAEDVTREDVLKSRSSKASNNYLEVPFSTAGKLSDVSSDLTPSYKSEDSNAGYFTADEF
eukprot:TRINITY_DN4897_c0_g1_i4.p1 TRINITY_DN4897_c0_g1~~TRINITY_DN4897_c0_g1_i4.p1  ORF type:complete len:757 (-),score=174.31 TRINITY_DN4897_c0_g1_i4:26-2263(-)